MEKIYLIVVADQDGDVDWTVCREWRTAVSDATTMQETAYDKPKIYEITLADLSRKEREWNRLDRKPAA